MRAVVARARRPVRRLQPGAARAQARPLARDRAMIWFLRHGDAADGADDFARELTVKGERQSRAAGEALAALGVEIDACLTSPPRTSCSDRGAGVRAAGHPAGAEARALRRRLRCRVTCRRARRGPPRRPRAGLLAGRGRPHGRPGRLEEGRAWRRWTVRSCRASSAGSNQANRLNRVRAALNARPTPRSARGEDHQG